MQQNFSDISPGRLPINFFLLRTKEKLAYKQVGQNAFIPYKYLTLLKSLLKHCVLKFVVSFAEYYMDTKQIVPSFFKNIFVYLHVKFCCIIVFSCLSFPLQKVGNRWCRTPSFPTNIFLYLYVKDCWSIVFS